MKDCLEVLKALADPNRLRVFWLLARIDERICVAEAMDVLGESHYNASRILKSLKQAGLVTAEREGKWVFYSLPAPLAGSFHAHLLKAIQAIPAENFSEEIKRCQLRLGMREHGECIVGADSDAWRNVSTQAQTKRKPAARKRRTEVV